MNRLSTSLGVIDSSAGILTDRRRLRRVAEVDDGCHATFTPMHYESNYAYPLIVWLHSPGGNERELKRIMPLVSMRNYVGIAARGTVTTNETVDRECGFDWSQDEDHTFLAQQRVMSGLAMASRRFNIDTSRVYLAGYQTGGTMAFRLAMAHPECFAGVLSIGGSFPRGGAPLMRYSRARKLPVFLATGRDSVQYPDSDVCQDLRLFHAAGIHVTLRQYPCGDEMTTNMLSDMDHWVMESLSRTVLGVVR